jgi:hypothetical protein
MELTAEKFFASTISTLFCLNLVLRTGNDGAPARRGNVSAIQDQTRATVVGIAFTT